MFRKLFNIIAATASATLAFTLIAGQPAGADDGALPEVNWDWFCHDGEGPLCYSPPTPEPEDGSDDAGPTIVFPDGIGQVFDEPLVDLGPVIELPPGVLDPVEDSPEESPGTALPSPGEPPVDDGGAALPSPGEPPVEDGGAALPSPGEPPVEDGGAALPSPGEPPVDDGSTIVPTPAPSDAGIESGPRARPPEVRESTPTRNPENIGTAPGYEQTATTDAAAGQIVEERDATAESAGDQTGPLVVVLAGVMAAALLFAGAGAGVAIGRRNR